MNRSLYALCLVAALLGTCLGVRADDLTDVQQAFHTLHEYQKSDNPRTLELFAPDVSVTLLLTYEGNVRPTYLPRAQFFAGLKKELSLKKGTKDVYEETKYTKEGDNVRVTSTLVDGATGKKGPITLLYVRDDKGVYRIKEMRITVQSPRPLPSVF